MQAKLKVYCGGCDRAIGQASIDTADMPEELQRKVNTVVLEHRKDCPVYSYPGVAVGKD